MAKYCQYYPLVRVLDPGTCLRMREVGLLRCTKCQAVNAKEEKKEDPQMTRIAHIKKGLIARLSRTQGENPGQGGSPGKKSGNPGRFGHEALNTADEQRRDRHALAGRCQSLSSLDRKILAQVARNQQNLVGIVKLQAKVIRDLSDRIEELEADLRRIGKIRISPQRHGEHGGR